MREDEFDVAYRLLDDELVDSDDRRCGRVDDIEFDCGPGGAARISTILSGPGVWHSRLPRRLRPLAKRVFGDDFVRVPWEAVQDIGAVVNLKQPGRELGLGKGDDRMGELIGKLPRSD
jgi:sporulation protein YlmC with PRC-barrel domain